MLAEALAEIVYDVCVYTHFPRRLLVLVLVYFILIMSLKHEFVVCVCVCYHNRSSICWRRLVTNLVSPAPVETRHIPTHTH